MVSEVWKSTPELRTTAGIDGLPPVRDDDLVGLDTDVVVDDQLVGADEPSMPLEERHVRRLETTPSSLAGRRPDAHQDPVPDGRPVDRLDFGSDPERRRSPHAHRHIRRVDEHFARDTAAIDARPPEGPRLDESRLAAGEVLRNDDATGSGSDDGQIEPLPLLRSPHRWSALCPWVRRRLWVRRRPPELQNAGNGHNDDDQRAPSCRNQEHDCRRRRAMQPQEVDGRALCVLGDEHNEQHEDAGGDHHSGPARTEARPKPGLRFLILLLIRGVRHR